MKKENEVARKGFSKTIWFWVIATSIGFLINYSFILSTINMTFKSIPNAELVAESMMLRLFSFLFLVTWFLMAVAYINKLYIKELEKDNININKEND